MFCVLLSCISVFCFFFFKQKTAYEMRISDWSSDVCSSDLKRPDRIVVGTEDHLAAEAMREIYRPLYLNKAPLVVTSRRTAELIKYAANAFLATKITFINEIADLCEMVGADVQDVSRGIGLDNRIGSKFLPAGPERKSVV